MISTFGKIQGFKGKNLSLESLLSIALPSVVLLLVFLTKRLIFSLGVGLLLGAIFVKYQTPLQIPQYLLSKFLSVFRYIDGGEVHINWYAIHIFIFLALLGILPQVFIHSGSINSFVKWAHSKVKDPRSSEWIIFVAGCVIFIDDQFNALTLGRSMRPLSDASGLSRERLAYIIDSTSAPVCILLPLSSWGAYIIGILNGVLPDPSKSVGILSASIGLNFYAWFALLAVFLSILWRIHLPVMRKNFNVGVDLSVIEREAQKQGSMWALILPILSLVFITLGMIFFTGYQKVQMLNFRAIVENTNISLSVLVGGICATLFAILLSSKTIQKQEYVEILKEGIKISLPSIIILILAWAIGDVVRYDLKTGEHLSELIAGIGGENLLYVLPLILFVFSIIIAFATGTSWGCFAVMIPVGIALALHSGLDLVVATSAILAGAIYGDHISPISDTTILTSAGTGCSVQSHFITQLPYASISAICAFISFVILSLSGSVLVAYIGGGSLLVLVFYYLKKKYALKQSF